MIITKNSHIGIIGGRGKTGSQFAKLFRAAGFRVFITGSRDAHRNATLIKRCDIIIFSLPLSLSATRITELAQYAVRTDQLILDVSSLKEHEVEAMLKFPGEVIGMHPLFGPSTDPKGERVILCPERARPQTIRWLRSLLASVGVNTAIMTPIEHDHLMATVQAIPHLKSFFIADVLRLGGVNLKKTLSQCTPIYEHEFNIVGRFLDDHPDLYVPIIFRNPQTLHVLKNMRTIINEYIDIAEKKDFARAESRYAACKKYFHSFLHHARKRSEICIRALLDN